VCTEPSLGAPWRGSVLPPPRRAALAHAKPIGKPLDRSAARAAQPQARGQASFNFLTHNSSTINVDLR
jgi:hypothetical protein